MLYVSERIHCLILTDWQPLQETDLQWNATFALYMPHVANQNGTVEALWLNKPYKYYLSGSDH